MKKIAVCIGALLGLLLSVSCDNALRPNTSAASVTFSITGRVAAPAAVVTYTVTVTASDMETIVWANLTPGLQSKTVPEGVSRRFVFEKYVDGVKSDTGSTVMTIGPGMNSVAVTLTAIVLPKADPSISAWPTASSITFGQDLSSSLLSGGTSSPSGIFTFTTPATVPGVGTADQSVTFTPADTAAYRIVTGLVSVEVTKAAPVITTWPTASSITSGQDLSASVLSGGVTSPSGIFTFTTPATVPGVGTADQSVTFTPTDTAGYLSVTGGVSVTVTVAAKATPVITTWPTASSITFGQDLSASVLSGGVSSPSGIFTFTTLSTVPGVGTADQPVTFTPTDTAGYLSVTGVASVTVNSVAISPALDSLVLIAGGATTIGDAENPVHTVNLSSFLMSTTECTQGEYLRVMGSNPSNFTGDLTLPVERVTWYDAVRYCIKRSIDEGLPVCYDTTNWSCNIAQQGYRLPTESEWEYACRAGSTGMYYYPDADTLANAWCNANSEAKTHPVATKTANANGLYDMSGNVWEWCGDWYAAFTSATLTNPTGPVTGSNRVLRGGSIESSANLLRTSYRYHNPPPDAMYYTFGFRVVRSVP